MEMKDVLKKLREKNSLTQEQMAKRVMVTRQAVSRWETGETQPNTDTLKLLSQEFEVSVNTLLGSPRRYPGSSGRFCSGGWLGPGGPSWPAARPRRGPYRRPCRK